MRISLIFFTLLFLSFPVHAKDSTEIIYELCVKEHRLYGYAGFVRCGEYYRGDFNTPDMPDVLYDSKGKMVTECGGMPLPDGHQKGNNDARCQIPCEDISHMIPCQVLVK